MTAALLIYSIIAGIAIVEGLIRASARIGISPRLAQVKATLQAFQTADDDDARQALMIRAGMSTLTLSVLLFVVFAIAGLVVALPLIWFGPTGFDLAWYMVGLTIAAAIWWHVRHRGR